MIHRSSVSLRFVGSALLAVAVLWAGAVDLYGNRERANEGARIGNVIAARIIAARPFKSADDLKKVSGIGDKIRPDPAIFSVIELHQWQEHPS